MKKIKEIVLIVVLLSMPLIMTAQSRKVIIKNKTYEAVDGEYYLKGRAGKDRLVKDNVIIKMKDGFKFTDIPFHKYDLPELKVKSVITLSDYQVIKIPVGYDLIDIIMKLHKIDAIELIEPNAYAEYSSVPNDPYYVGNYQWNLTKIEMPKVWDITTGSSTVKVAVIGSGTKYDHEDLINQLNTSYKGWNYATNTDNPLPYNDHETKCAGVIGASINNNKGISGIAGGWNGGGIKMMYFQCCEDVWTPPTLENVADAIGRAIQNGAKVISISLNWSSETYAPLNTKINDAALANVIVCLSSGDQYGEEDFSIKFPATNSNAIAVGATIQNDNIKTFGGDWGSCYGTNLHIAAPGQDIPTTLINIP